MNDRGVDEEKMQENLKKIREDLKCPRWRAQVEALLQKKESKDESKNNT